MLQSVEKFINEHENVKERLCYVGMREDRCLILLTPHSGESLVGGAGAYDLDDGTHVYVDTIWRFIEKVHFGDVIYIGFLASATDDYHSEIYDYIRKRLFSTVVKNELQKAAIGIVAYLASYDDMTDYVVDMINARLKKEGLDKSFEAYRENDTAMIKSYPSSDNVAEFSKMLFKLKHVLCTPYKVKPYKNREQAFRDLDILTYVLEHGTVDGFTSCGNMDNLLKADERLYDACENGNLPDYVVARQNYKELTRWLREKTYKQN